MWIPLHALRLTSLLPKSFMPTRLRYDLRFYCRLEMNIKLTWSINHLKAPKFSYQPRPSNCPFKHGIQAFLWPGLVFWFNQIITLKLGENKLRFWGYFFIICIRIFPTTKENKFINTIYNVILAFWVTYCMGSSISLFEASNFLQLNTNTKKWCIWI